MTGPENPLVSVIIPFLNGGLWLAEAVESVLKQTYFNWEIILIDDGSDEEHTDIARRYSLQHPEKILYSDHPGHTNKGVTVSRNLGIALSKGGYIAFLDSDDRWLPQKLHHQLHLFRLHPKAEMVCEASCFWHSWNNPAMEDTVVQVGAEQDKLHHPPQLLHTLYPLGKGAPPCPTGIMIKRGAFNRSGGFEEAFIGVNQLYEDQAFLCKIYLREKIYISGSPNNMYRKRPGSLTGAADDKLLYHRVRSFFLGWFEEYVKSHFPNKPEIQDLINKAWHDMQDV